MSQRQFRVLVVGVGSIGERHVRCFQDTGRATVGVCDINPRLLDQITRRYDVTACGTDFAAALRQSSDVVVIATPANLHVPLALQAARAGRHVLIEKPLSTSLEGIAELTSVARERRLTVAVAYVLRAHAALAAMREEIRSGRLGRPLHLYASCGQHFPTYRPAYREIYYRDHRTGGGAAQDALTHLINTGEWLVGPVNRLVADAEHQQLAGVDVEDTVNVLSRHGAVLASYTLNQYQAPNELAVTVACEQGTARFEYHRARWRQMTLPDAAWQDATESDLERDTLFLQQADAFLDAVEHKTPPLCSVDEATNTLRAVLAVLSSSADASRWIETGAVPS